MDHRTMATTWRYGGTLQEEKDRLAAAYYSSIVGGSSTTVQSSVQSAIQSTVQPTVAVQPTVTVQHLQNTVFIRPAVMPADAVLESGPVYVQQTGRQGMRTCGPPGNVQINPHDKRDLLIKQQIEFEAMYKDWLVKYETWKAGSCLHPSAPEVIAQWEGWKSKLLERRQLLHKMVQDTIDRSKRIASRIQNWRKKQRSRR